MFSNGIDALVTSEESIKCVESPESIEGYISKRYACILLLKITLFDVSVY